MTDVENPVADTFRGETFQVASFSSEKYVVWTLGKIDPLSWFRKTSFVFYPDIKVVICCLKYNFGRLTISPQFSDDFRWDANRPIWRKLKICEEENTFGKKEREKG